METLEIVSTSTRKLDSQLQIMIMTGNTNQCFLSDYFFINKNYLILRSAPDIIALSGLSLVGGFTLVGAQI